MMNLQTSVVTRFQGVPKPIRFGEDESYRGMSVAGVSWSADGVVNRANSGNLYPLMVGLRPAQEKTLQQIAANTQTTNTQLTALTDAVNRLTSALQNRLIN